MWGGGGTANNAASVGGEGGVACVCMGNKEHFMLNSWHRLSEAARAKLATMQQANAKAEAEATRCVSYQFVVKSCDDTCCPLRERVREREGESRSGRKTT